MKNNSAKPVPYISLTDAAKAAEQLAMELQELAATMRDHERLGGKGFELAQQQLLATVTTWQAWRQTSVRIVDLTEDPWLEDKLEQLEQLASKVRTSGRTPKVERVLRDVGLVIDGAPVRTRGAAIAAAVDVTSKALRHVRSHVHHSVVTSVLLEQLGWILGMDLDEFSKEFRELFWIAAVRDMEGRSVIAWLVTRTELEPKADPGSDRFQDQLQRNRAVVAKACQRRGGH